MQGTNAFFQSNAQNPAPGAVVATGMASGVLGTTAPAFVPSTNDPLTMPFPMQPSIPSASSVMHSGLQIGTPGLNDGTGAFPVPIQQTGLGFSGVLGSKVSGVVNTPMNSAFQVQPPPLNQMNYGNNHMPILSQAQSVPGQPMSNQAMQQPQGQMNNGQQGNYYVQAPMYVNQNGQSMYYRQQGKTHSKYIPLKQNLFLKALFL